ncbi:MAG: B12-binding domain-containing radical SAM protein [Deltaproteobacteria bacterium]|nr:B12-binding domain-containing radical SAM protein [Deltaproteobacteria bacterium]
MKILFIYSTKEALPFPARPIRYWNDIQMGISYISSYLKSCGFATRLIVLPHANYSRVIDADIALDPPDIVCFTSVASEFYFVNKIARYIRKKIPDCYMVIGGAHASLQPDEVLKGAFDCVCVGEGELPVRELAALLQLGQRPAHIPHPRNAANSTRGDTMQKLMPKRVEKHCVVQNLWFKNNDAVIKNETRDFMKDLDAFPLPDREMWRPWVADNSRHVILLGRGCPFNCTYCSNHKLREISKGQYVRLRAPQNILVELQHLCDAFPNISEVYFEVETITANEKWALELCRLLTAFNAKRGRRLLFGTNVRAPRNKSLRGLFDTFVRAGFGYINMGIESGSENVRRQVLQRHESNEDIIRTCDEAHQAGLRVNAYNLIGLPGETPDDFKETIKINRRCLPDANFLSVFFPYPGTGLYNTCFERGIELDSSDDVMERYVPVLNLPEFSNRQVTHYFRWFDWYVYRGRRPILGLLYAALYRTIRAHARLYKIYRLMSVHPFLYSLKQRMLRTH